MHIAAFVTLLLATECYSLAYGGVPERIAAAIVGGGVAASVLLGGLHPHLFHTVDTWLLTVDATMFVAVLALAVRADRFWPMAMAACLGVGMLVHVAIWASGDITPVAYATFNAFSGYPVLLVLAIGAHRHRRRLRSRGFDPDWS